jgi:hypothetical protein
VALTSRCHTLTLQIQHTLLADVLCDVQSHCMTRTYAWIPSNGLEQKQ